MMRNILLYFLIFCQPLWALQEGGSPKASVAQPVFNFGQVLAGERVTHVFKIENKGDAPLQISRLRTSCGCTSVLLDQPVVPPGGAASIQATFETHGRRGEQMKSIHFDTNDPALPQVELKFTGQVQPRIRIEPETVYFKKGGEKKSYLSVKNETDHELQILNISTSSDYLKVFSEGSYFCVELKQGYPYESVNEKVAFFTNDPLQPIVWISVWGVRR